MYIIKNAKIIVKDNETKIQDILIQEGKIARIADIVEVEATTYDAKEQLVIPGAIDVHAHLREPGYTHKETIKSGTLAAAKGGFTTIMAMPNVIPYPDNADVIKSYLQKIQQDAVVNVIPYACITKEEKGKQLVDFKAIKQLGIEAFSDDGIGVASETTMKEAMQEAKVQDVMIVAHTEDMAYRPQKGCMHLGVQSKKLGLEGIDSACEYKQVERDLKLAKEVGCKYHICHMSAKESVQMLKEYKAMGADVSGEVTTHHLVLSELDVENTNHKMNPPLRSEEDRQALIDGLLDGSIDFIANDHAPHSESEKDTTMDKAPFGIVALETSMPLLYTKFVKTGIFTLEQFVKFTSTNAAKRFHFTSKGLLEEGYDADLIVLSEKEEVIQKETFVSLGKNTPFDGYRCSGFPILTIVGGQVVYQK